MSVHAVEPTPQDSPVEDKAPGGIDSLTAAETAMAERKAGQSITSLGNDLIPQVGLLGALAWMLARRQDKRVTYEAYMASHTVEQITQELNLNSDTEEDEGKDDGEST